MNPADSLFHRIKKEGLRAIQRLIDEDTAETTWLDFKRYGGTGNEKRDWKDARANFSRAISGFGNSDGGIIIWGVTCVANNDQPDVASDLAPIANLARFHGRLNDWIAEATMPSHVYVENHPIAIDNDSGLIASYIPLSPVRPLQQRFGARDFVIRAGSRFDEAPYNLLAGMFGLRPPPTIEPDVRINISVSDPRKDESRGVRLKVHVLARNLGPVSAERVFANIASGSPDYRLFSTSFSGFSVSNLDNRVCYANQEIGQYLPPGQSTPIVSVLFDGQLNGIIFDRDLDLRIELGAEQASIKRFSLKASPMEIAKCAVWAMENRKKELPAGTVKQFISGH